VVAVLCLTACQANYVRGGGSFREEQLPPSSSSKLIGVAIQ
nr:hypothetical protein - Escherichia coli plasmid ColD [Escherichia coli]